MKKVIIPIICVIIAMAMCIGFASCSKDTDGDKNESVASGVVVTDDNGETVTDENGKVLTSKVNNANSNDTATSKKDNGKKTTGKPVTDKNGNTVTDKNGATVTEKQSTTKKGTTKKGEKPKTTTTTTTIVYTTIDNTAEIVLPDLPEDGYLLTGDLAMMELQSKYDETVYIVNVTEEKKDTVKLTVYYLKDSEVYSTATVNLKTGKTVEIIKETGKKSTYYLGK